MIRIGAVLLLLTMSGCAAIPATAPAVIPSPPASAYGKPVQVIGMDAKRLIAAFGQPRLDIRERSARKLQFTNGKCVLDAYLYTPAKGKEPAVTYADARLPDGRDTDVGVCAMGLATK